jgi:hypothetical protein
MLTTQENYGCVNSLNSELVVNNYDSGLIPVQNYRKRFMANSGL